jgi:hypothetical protein
VRLRLEPVEVHVLSTVFTELADALESDALPADDPVRQRLFPAAYRDDEAAATEFRELTERTLRSERTERARSCVVEAGSGGSAGSGSEDAAAAGVDLHLDSDAGTRWITALNDVRLVLGIRLGITEDEMGDPDDPADAPHGQQRALYFWLTTLQDSLVQAMMP